VATGVTLSANPTSPANVGDNVLFTAVASGGSGTYEYQFWLYNGDGTWAVKKPYATPGNAWTWDTTGMSAGTYSISVGARSVGSTAGWDTFQVVTYVLQGPGAATSVTLTPSPASPGNVGDNVLFAAVASGGSGTYEYQFWLYNGDGTWTVKKPYATPGNAWTWDTTGMTAGATYYVSVGTRNAGSAAAWDCSQVVAYTFSESVTSVTLTPSPGSPQTLRPSVLWTGSASGGSGSYEYQFWLYNGDGTWTVKKPSATPGNTWTWDTTGLTAGTYYVDVSARNAGSSSAWDVYQVVPFVLE